MEAAEGMEAMSAERVYQCVLLESGWHITQEQATPPPVHLGGAWTVCGPWAAFTRGYEKRRPTCPKCVEVVERHERDVLKLDKTEDVSEEATLDTVPREKAPAPTEPTIFFVAPPTPFPVVSEAVQDALRRLGQGKR